MSALVKTYVPGNAFPSFPSLFENFLRNESLSPAFDQTLPAVNVLENENAYKIELAAPGLKKEDFKVNLVERHPNENTLTISAEKESKNEENTEKFTRKEFSYSSFKRSFTLPKSVDGEKISATYNDGILLLELPKKEETKPKEPREIAIA